MQGKYIDNVYFVHIWNQLKQLILITDKIFRFKYAVIQDAI